MKKVLLIVTLFLSCMSLSAQRFVAAFQLTQRLAAVYGHGYLPVAGGGYLGLKKTSVNAGGSTWNKYRVHLELVKVNAQGGYEKQGTLAGGAEGFSALYSELKKIGDQFWLFYIEPAAGNHIGDIKAAPVDPLTLALGEPKVIAAGTSMGMALKFFDGFQQYRIWSKASPDGQYTYLFVSTAKGPFYFSCLDEALNLVWGKKETLPGVEDKMIQSAEVDNDGVVYLGFVKDGRGQVAVYSTGGKRETRTLDLGSGSPKEVLLLTHRNGVVSVAGTYSEGDENTVGVYRGSIGTAQKPAALEKTAFPAPLVKQLAIESWASLRARKYGLFPLYSAQLYELEDGALDMAFEFKRSSAAPSTVYQSGSILNMVFRGSAPVFSRVPKYSVDSIFPEPMFHAAPTGNKMTVLYYDHPANLEKAITADPKPVNGFRNAVLVAAVIEPDGTVKRQRASGL